ncbi:MAG: 5-carboxymethyl-2-hydroxymuconate Delta-isomerase [Gammaproteobacteria bacterium]|nr:5-carboxymethyl-2-hydroxymuconate Delta-isomerase [Gammaproteobacteria bacterium]
MRKCISNAQVSTSNYEVNVPNILLEFTQNILDPVDFKDLFSEIHKILHEQGGIKLDNCKSRAAAVEHYHIGDGHPSNAFVQLTLHFIAGRSLEAKQRIGTACLAQLKHSYAKSMARLDLQVTVEIVDINPDEYFKYPEDSLTPQ